MPADLVPLNLSFRDGLFVRRLTAGDVRKIEKTFPHYGPAAGPLKNGRMVETSQEEFNDALLVAAVVDAEGKPAFANRETVAELVLPEYGELAAQAFAVINGKPADAEKDVLRGFWDLAQPFLGADKAREAVAGDLWDALNRYAEDARKNFPRLAPATG
jgi:hypothetical protein